MKLKKSNLAIFSRNYRKYLNEAARKGHNEPVTFRSKLRWVTAEKAIKASGPCRIYFAEQDTSSRITYAAELMEVQIGPSLMNPRTKRLLRHELDSTRGEQLWGDTAQTLYVISNCRKLKRPFAQAKLRKANDGKPLDANYIRSYALVRVLSRA